MNMGVAFSTVLVMLLYALPGFIMIKTGLIKSDAISAFAKVLMYVCSPMLIIYSLIQVKYSVKMVTDMLTAFAIMLVLSSVVLLTVYLILRKKGKTDVRYRIYTISSTFSNNAFMGIPVLEALLPDYPEAIALASMASLSLNILSWTAGSAIITNDRKYMSIRKILLNPAILALVVAVPLFVSGYKLPSQLDSMITMLGRMSTPMCMLIMGMRLACTTFKSVFAVPAQYIMIGVKQILFPLITLLVLLPLPIDYNMKAAIYIMMACPVASVVLNFSEMLGEGQKTAAGMVLLGTILSALTIPVMVLLI